MKVHGGLDRRRRLAVSMEGAPADRRSLFSGSLLLRHGSFSGMLDPAKELEGTAGAEERERHSRCQ